MDGKDRRVLNQKETTLAQQKQQAIKDAFANWIWQDPQRRTALVKQYNELFNSTRPREYDGSHIHFVGMKAKQKEEKVEETPDARPSVLAKLEEKSETVRPFKSYLDKDGDAR